MIPNTYLANMLANEHVDDLRRAADAHRRARHVAGRRASWRRSVLNRLIISMRRNDPWLAPRWEEQ